MNSNAWAEVVLVASVLAPLVTLVPAFTLPADPERFGRAGCMLAAAGWGVLLIGGQHPEVGRFAPDELAMAAAIGVSLFGARAIGASAVPVTVVTAALAIGHPGDPSTVAPLLGIALVAVLVAVAGRTHPVTTAAVALAVVVGAVGVNLENTAGPALVVVSSAAVAVAASVTLRSPLVVVVPAALVEAIRVGPRLADTTTSRWLAVGLAVLALLVLAGPAVNWRVPPFPIAAALVPWALIAAVGPFADAIEAARPLAAGAVLALLLGGPLALVATLPGTVLLADSVAGGSGATRLALGALAFAAIALACFTQPAEQDSPTEPVPVDAVALALVVWLVVRPTAWTWLQVSGLRSYMQGVALGTAAALAAGIALYSLGAAWHGADPARLLLADTAEPVTAPAHVRRVTAAAALAMGIVAAVLVRSASL
jgi:hypothetical protein